VKIGIRISQYKSPRVFGFMIKKWQIGDQIHDHNRGELRDHPEATRASNSIDDEPGVSCCS
jgi:hypothetical protein